MSKSTTPIDEYICTLRKETQKVAETELRETELTRNSALKSIREWAEKNPRINKMRMDSSFLLRFLRSKKFSVPMAEDAIERYLLLRQTYHGAIFKNLDYKRPAILELINKGYCFPVPNRDALGRRIIIYRPNVFDLKTYTNIDLMIVHGVLYETLLEDEENQVNGIIHIADASKCGFPLLTLFTPKEAARLAKNGEKVFPMRHKIIAGINVVPALKFAVDFGLSLVSQKMRGRIHTVTSFDNLPFVDNSLLPKEYGGVVPMEEMIEMYKLELEAKRQTLLDNDKMLVNLSMYSQGAQDGSVVALRNPIDSWDVVKDHGVYGIQGSFRKLEVD